MDRPSQEPAAQPDGAESPLSFPVEAPRPAGPEPGAGAPQAEPLRFPAEVPGPEGTFQPADVSPLAEPLRFPAEASEPDAPSPGVPRPADVPPRAEPLRFPAEAPPPEGVFQAADVPPRAEPLREAARPEGAIQAADVPPLAEPLRFPAEAPRPEAPSQTALQSADVSPPSQPSPFPGAASSPPGPPFHPAELPYPVAQLPASVPSSTQPPPQAAGQPAAEPPVPAAASLLRFAPPVLAVVAAVMTLLGAFLPLFRIREHLGASQRYLDTQMLITETAWGHTIEVPDQQITDQAGAPVGVPLLFAVVVLVAAALITFGRPGHRLGRWLIAAGAVFAAGVVSTAGTSGIGWSARSGEVEVTVATGPGLWLLIGGTVVAAAAAVVAYLPWRQPPGWADPALAYADTPTPPSGVAITVLPPDDEQH